MAYDGCHSLKIRVDRGVASEIFIISFQRWKMIKDWIWIPTATDVVIR